MDITELKDMIKNASGYEDPPDESDFIVEICFYQSEAIAAVKAIEKSEAQLEAAIQWLKNTEESRVDVRAFIERLLG